MDQGLQNIIALLQNHPGLSVDEKAILLAHFKELDKKITITEFKLDRTEKVKRITAILLKELEHKRKTVEEALHESKATQSQLVQQEKLASLGQLTACIAHEIKNHFIRENEVVLNF